MEDCEVPAADRRTRWLHATSPTCLQPESPSREKEPRQSRLTLPHRQLRYKIMGLPKRRFLPKLARACSSAAEEQPAAVSVEEASVGSSSIGPLEADIAPLGADIVPRLAAIEPLEAVLPADEFDAVFDAPGYFGNVLGSLVVKGFCVIDARCLPSVDASRLKFARCPSNRAFDVHLGDWLLGRMASQWIRHLPEESEEQWLGQGLHTIDKRLRRLSENVGAMLPLLAAGNCSTQTFLLKANEGVLPDTDDPKPVLLRGAEAASWLENMATARLAIFAFLGPGEGILELTPNDGHESEPLRLRTSPGAVVALRPEVISARHVQASAAPTIAMVHFRVADEQQKPLRESAMMHGRTSLSPFLQPLRDLVFRCPQEGLTRPKAPAAEQCRVRSEAFNLPGKSPFGGGFLQSVLAGADLVLELSTKRFAMDQYFDPVASRQECFRKGKTYSRHASFIADPELFANTTFGLTPEEACTLPPSVRIGMEVTFEAAYRAGLRCIGKQPCHADMLVAIDRSESLFSHSRPMRYSAFPAQGNISSCEEAGRISCNMGFDGLSCVVDTDGSSSLVALQLALSRHSNRQATSRSLHHQPAAFSAVLGSAWNLNPFGFIAFSTRGLMTRAGRSFVFDRTATGCVRAEGAVALILSQEDGNASLPPSGIGSAEASLGELQSVAISSCGGKSASVTRPAHLNMEEAMDLAAQQADVEVVDGVECSAHGSAVFDTVEAMAAAKVFPLFLEDERLHLTATKSTLGSGHAAAGLFAMLRVLEEARAGCFCMNVHLATLSSYIESKDRNLQFATETCLHEPDWTGGPVCVNSFGFSGTLASAIVRPCVGPAYQDVSASKSYRIMPVTYWPDTSNELPPWALPLHSYQLAGSFCEWDRPQEMEEIRPGVWRSTIVLGENGWESFQIWLDGDKSRVLHPDREQASSAMPVDGPDEYDLCSGQFWQIGGDPLPLPFTRSRSGRGEKSFRLNMREAGQRGDIYEVTLHVTGQHRRVRWRNLGRAREIDGPLVQVTSAYYVSANWNNWALVRMEQDPETAGLWSFRARPRIEEGAFFIVRNKDEGQAFFPEVESSEDPGGRVRGPAENVDRHSWLLRSSCGGEAPVEIRFRRVVGKTDERSISWSWLVREKRALTAAGRGVI